MHTNNKICLNMIVRNESSIITKCLESVYKWIDYWVICDTGSTDETPTIIDKFFNEHKIPGRLINHTWKNFGYNRNIALNEVDKFTSDYEISIDYIMLIDADMKLKISDVKWKENLNGTHVLAKQIAGYFSYYNVRLINNNFKHKYMCPTHEYIKCINQKPTKIIRTDSIYFIDDANGYNRKDKFERDIQILKEALISDPTNTRYMFYLAQSYRDNGDVKDALKWYNKRVNSGGWIEEIYYSYYQIALLYMNSGKYELKYVKDAFLISWTSLKSRSEPLYMISELYRMNNNWEKCYKWSKRCNNIKIPSNLSLFINEDIYKFKCKYNYALSSMNIGKCKESISIYSDLLNMNDLPIKLIDTIFKDIGNILNKYPNSINECFLLYGKNIENIYILIGLIKYYRILSSHNIGIILADIVLDNINNKITNIIKQKYESYTYLNVFDICMKDKELYSSLKRYLLFKLYIVYEISIIAYYVNRKKDGHNACKYILKHHSANSSIGIYINHLYDSTQHNIKYY